MRTQRCLQVIPNLVMGLGYIELEYHTDTCISEEQQPTKLMAARKEIEQREDEWKGEFHRKPTRAKR